MASPTAEARKRFFAGGGLGLGFGNVDFVDLSGILGYRVTTRVSTGLRLSWRNREDNRVQPEITTNDYGASVFGRVLVAKPVFVQAEYEYLSYEFVRPGIGTDRTDFDSVLVGAGASQSLSPHVSLFLVGLYNLSYDDDESPRPYDSPFVFRAGIGVHF